MRVFELAKELGMTSSQLLAELRSMGEYVKSARAGLPSIVVKRVRAAYPVAAPSSQGDETVTAAHYGRASEFVEQGVGEVGESFQDAVEHARRRSAVQQAIDQNEPARRNNPLTPIGYELLKVAVVPRRHSLDTRRDDNYSTGELAQARQLSAAWAQAQLSGLSCSEAEVIAWIRASGGRHPDLVAQLVRNGVTLHEATTSLWYGRVRDGRPTLLERVIGGSLTTGDAISQVYEWRRSSAAG